MVRSINDLTVFDLSSIDRKDATLYSKDGGKDAFIYIGSDKYKIAEDGMALAQNTDVPADQKFLGFNFKEDVKLEGVIIVWQYDEHYMVCFGTEAFSGNAGAVNDVILLKVGNALEDLEK